MHISAQYWWVLVHSIVPGVCRGSNWAQLAGERAQNYAVPYKETPEEPFFSSRAGHASVVVKEDEQEKVILLGGDDFQDNKGGPKNDVWSSSGWGWTLETNGIHPAAASAWTWNRVTAGRVPPSGVNYNDWIICQEPMRGILNDSTVCEDVSVPPGSYKRDSMWSPRKDHAVVELNGRLILMGGRAREHTNLPYSNAAGRLLQVITKEDPFFSPWREVQILKNDVWASDDGGKIWQLLTPGCLEHYVKVHLLPAYPTITEKSSCSSDSDCFGAAVCKSLEDGSSGTCFCPMWSPREAHRALVHDGKIYISGGFSAMHRGKCGLFDCKDGVDPSGSLRMYMDDVWASEDGINWQLITESAPWGGRGDHAMVVSNDETLLVMGGIGEGEQLYHDIWRSALPSDGNDALPHSWVYDGEAEWSARGGLAVVIEEAAAINAFQGRMYVVGVYGEGGTPAEDFSWSIALSDDDDDDNMAEKNATELFSFSNGWKEDFSVDQPYRSAATTDAGYSYGDPPQAMYLDLNSPINKLKQVKLSFSSMSEREANRQPELVPYLSETELAALLDEGIETIQDAANMDKYVIFRLRGYGLSEQKEAPYKRACDLKCLAQDFIDKCSLSEYIGLSTGDAQQPGMVVPSYGGILPSKREDLDNAAQWYEIITDTSTDIEIESGGDGEKEQIAAWDGCSDLHGITNPNVRGIGFVTIPKVKNPLTELQEMHCRVGPKSRSGHTMVYTRQALTLIGGREKRINNSYTGRLMNDVWARDDRIPTAFIDKHPRSSSPDSTFTFKCDEPTCYYEVRLLDADENLEAIPWISVVDSYTVSWLDKQKGGPGESNYVLFARAVDPAGNTDFLFREGINMYSWRYVSPLRTGMIWGLSCSGFAVLLLVYVEYRRRRKKQALERYAMKRMRRKFVQQQKKRAEDGRNWKGVYDEEKGGYYGDNNNSRISSKGEGRAAIGKKAKPKRVEINNERLKKKEIRQ